MALCKFAQLEPTHCFFINKLNDLLYAHRFCQQLFIAQRAAAHSLFNGGLLLLEHHNFILKPLILAALVEGEFTFFIAAALLLGLRRTLCSLLGSKFSCCSTLLLAPIAPIGVVTGEILYIALAIKNKNVVYNLVHKIAVVAHHNNAPLEVAQILLEHLKGFNIEVVGGLVEHKEVGRRHQYSAEIEPATLATAELAHIIILLRGGEEKMLQKLRCCETLSADVDNLGNLFHCIDDAHILVEGDSILTVVAPFYRLAHLDGATILLGMAEQHFYECGLSRAVVSNDKLTVKLESLKAEKVSAMILLSEEARRMMEMMEAYANNEEFKAMFAHMKPDETLVLNKNNKLVQTLLSMAGKEEKKEDANLLSRQMYDLALMSHRPLNSDEMTAFIDRSNMLLERLAELEK